MLKIDTKERGIDLLVMPLNLNGSIEYPGTSQCRVLRFADKAKRNDLTPLLHFGGDFFGGKLRLFKHAVAVQAKGCV